MAFVEELFTSLVIVFGDVFVESFIGFDGAEFVMSFVAEFNGSCYMKRIRIT